MRKEKGDENCYGCNAFMGCLLHRRNIDNSCPCSYCIIKVSCTIICDNYWEWRFTHPPWRPQDFQDYQRRVNERR